MVQLKRGNNYCCCNQFLCILFFNVMNNSNNCSVYPQSLHIFITYLLIAKHVVSFQNGRPYT